MIYNSLVSETKNRYMAGQRIDIMELRSLIALKLKGLSNRKVADLLKINRKTVDVDIPEDADPSYRIKFKELDRSIFIAIC